MKSGSNLEKILTAGHFAVTGECGPPQGCDGDVVRKKAGYLKGYVDACNITDNQTSIVRMSSMGACMLAKEVGVEPLLQCVVRDRNRIALQSDILGAAALGIRNMLCLSGDHQIFGQDPGAKNVFDIDSMQLIRMVKNMRDEGVLMSGKELKGVPKMFIGAAVNPFADPFEFRVQRLAKKIAAGVDFVQTQCIYNLEKFEKYMKQTVDRGLHEKCYILGGVTPLKSFGMAKYMNAKVAGMDIPQAVLDRMKGAGKENAKAEGLKIMYETIARLQEIEGVAGVHVMAIEWEEKVPEIVKEAGLYPRPQVD
jgi:methylenetetrahydrofolate reductase (NADPH)